MTIRSIVPIIACSIVAACSSSSSPGGGSSSSVLPPPAAGQGIQLELSTTIAASTEDERCQFVQTTDDMWVNQQVIRYTPGSHHFILWRTPYTSIPTTDTTGTPVDTSGVFECPDGPPGKWLVEGLLGGAQSPDAPTFGGDPLPPGVAIHIPAGSILIMDLHVLNASTSPLDVSVLMNLITIPQSQVKQEGGVYFFYNPFIRIPANGSSSARMSCPVPNDVTLVNGQTHMHKQGLGGVVNLEDGTGKMLQQLYQTNLWSNPPVTVWSSPTLDLKAGQQIDYQCNYQNPGDTDVIQGLSAKTNEMCVWVGAYYPRDTAFEYCNGTGGWGNLGQAATWIGTGTADGPTTMTCLDNAAAAPMSPNFNDMLDGCVVQSCAALSKPMTAVIRCAQQAGSSYQTACASQVATLKATTCN
jgi:hypothetical protein